MTIEADYWDKPNIVRRTVSRPDLEPMVAERINDDPTSMLSTVRRGITIMDSRSVSMVDTQEDLQAIVDREMYKVLQIEQYVDIETLNMPHHEAYDVLELVKKNTISGVFQEVAWSMELAAGGAMRHTLARVVI
ncbi:hypothetical protein LJC56_10145 [Christensenellaceae bacterium OttesenSCG-928-K19]|nr:hypothetical protein [Christensenellaceae bacterium OttesenSCG-928-K19]